MQYINAIHPSPLAISDDIRSLSKSSESNDSALERFLKVHAPTHSPDNAVFTPYLHPPFSLPTDPPNRPIAISSAITPQPPRPPYRRVTLPTCSASSRT